MVTLPVAREGFRIGSLALGQRERAIPFGVGCGPDSCLGF